ncbi:hypothetical protein ACQ4PT_005621 [Festuca glaucescens]
MTPAPLEDDDLLSEIPFRPPPQPSSLPRASAVCKRWCSVVSAPRFIRRFRLRHRRNPPILGFFRDAADGIHFHPTMDHPNHVPSGRFFLQFHGCTLIGCRHGLVLAMDASWDQFLVWDPVTGDKHRAATPPGFGMDKILIDGTVLRAAGDHFMVVLVGYKQEQDPLAVACFYSLETSVWSNLIETPAAEDAMDYAGMPAVLVGDSLFWALYGTGDSSVVLEFDLDRQSLAVIQLPVDAFAKNKYLIVMRAEGGGLGLLSLSEYTA